MPSERVASTAKILSTLIPGSGQIYAGNISEGLKSLFLLAGLSYVTVLSITEAEYILTSTVYFPLLIRIVTHYTIFLFEDMCRNNILKF